MYTNVNVQLRVKDTLGGVNDRTRREDRGQGNPLLDTLDSQSRGGTLGTTGTVDRMVAYTQEKEYIRFPMTMLQKTPIQYESIYHKTTYFCRLGVTEVVYPETIGYRDGI